MKFAHAMIRSYDLEKSLKFYQELMGFKLDKKADLEDCSLYYLKGEDGFVLELTSNFVQEKKPYSVGRAFGHFAFDVKSMKEFTDKAEKLGYEMMYGGAFDIELKDDKGNVEKKLIAFLTDPDGNEIEIMQED